MRWLGIILLLAVPAVADKTRERQAAAAVDSAMREFYGTLRSKGDGNIASIRDKLIANLPYVGEKTAKSVRNQLDRVFAAKYRRSDSYLKCCAEVIASNGKRGINKLQGRYRKLARSHGTRAVIAEALGDCKNIHALKVLRTIIHDKEPHVAVAAIDGCAKYAGKTKEATNSTMRDLINLYAKVTSKAQGKKADSKERIRYAALKPAFDKALNAFSEGEKLDSAEAWDAWLREKMAKKE
ncbi:MAG: hypothetical protein ACYTGZ_02980 [Planctomycetota bacterium]